MNTNMSLGLDSPFSDYLSADTLSIAVIGPDAGLRQALVAALADCHGGEVREYTSYPPSLDDLPRLLQQYHDVILIEWDSNPEYALDLVEGIGVGAKTTLMVYSKKNDLSQTDPEQLMRCMRAGAREFLCKPFPHATVAEALVRAAARRPPGQSPEKQLGRLLVFCGSKGGAGVTAIACNFAVAIAEESAESTLLIDLDLPLGDAALNLGITYQYSTIDALQNSHRLDANFLSSLIVKHASGLYVLAAPGNYSAFQASDDDILKLLTIARENFRNVVVDAGSKLEIAGKATPFRDASTVYLVTQSGIPELRNANRLLMQNSKGDGPTMEVVLNRHESRGMRVQDEDIKKALTKPAKWKIPNDYATMSHMHDTATPVTSTDSLLATQFAMMARSVCGLPNNDEKEKKRGRGFLSFLKGSSAKEPAPFPSARPSSRPSERAFQTPMSSSGFGWPGDAPSRPSLTESANALREEAIRREVLRKRDEWREQEAMQEREDLLAREALQRKNSWDAFGKLDSPAANSTEDDRSPAQVEADEPEYLRGISKGAPRYVPEIETGLPLYVPETYASELVHGSDASQPSFCPEAMAKPPAFVAEEGAAEHAAFEEPVKVELPCTVERAAVAEEIDSDVETPTVMWQTPEPVVYGTPLDAQQFNATSSVPGSFAYIPADGYVLPVGMHILWATFRPADGEPDDEIHASVSLEVKKATPKIQWPIPEDLSAGVPLSAAQLNATSNVPGVFLYFPAEGEKPTPGRNTLSATFTPTDLLNYTEATAEVPLHVHPAISALVWSTPAAIFYGTALDATQLNATASCPGTFRYIPDLGSVLSVGKHSLHVDFTPEEGLGLPSSQAEVTLTVVKERPTIHWPAPASIVYGTPLSRNELNATASVPGKFVYIPGEGVILAAGKHTPTVIFTPADSANYATTQMAVPMMVLKATPILDWPTPRAITYGTALSTRELNTSASVPGRLVYTPAAGTTLPAGTHTLTVSMTPVDSANYAVAEATVELVVKEPEKYASVSAVQFDSGASEGSSSNRTSEAYPAMQRRWMEERKEASVFIHSADLTQKQREDSASASRQDQAGATRSAVGAGRVLEDESAYETRTYNGVTYLKDAEGRWHPLQ